MADFDPFEDYSPPHFPEPEPPLPSDLITSFSPQRSITNSLMNFLPHIPTHLYGTLDMLFYLYADDSLDTTVFELAVMEQIKDSPAALDEFKKILPSAASPFSNFNDRVRAVLYNDTGKYMLWLKALKAFKKGALNFAEFREKVEPHFANLTGLWKEFDSNFGYANGERADIAAADDADKSKQGSTSGDTDLDSQRSKSE